MNLQAQTKKVTSNLVGGAVGAIATYMIAKKKIENKYALVAVCLIGAVAGAYAESAVRAKIGAAKSQAMVKK